MAFDIDLSNWAVDFDLQDRAVAWLARQQGKESISWPPSGEQGLRRAYLEGVPVYLLAYSHRTTEKIIRIQIKGLSAKELLKGVSTTEVCRMYNMTETEVRENLTRYMEYKARKLNNTLRH